MAVKPMAGTASSVPATRPLTTSCAISPRSTSDHLHEGELGALGLLEADLAVEDVADVGEVARTAGALEVDLLALTQELQAVARAVDLGARALRNLPHGVAHGGAGGLALGPGDGQRDQADVIVALAGVRIEVAGPEKLGQALVAGRLHRGSRRSGVRPVGDLGRHRVEQLLVHR